MIGKERGFIPEKYDDPEYIDTIVYIQKDRQISSLKSLGKKQADTYRK